MAAYLFLVTCLAAGQSGTVAEDAGQSAAIRSQVRQLVRQLDDDHATVRQSAQEGLVALGPSILPLLPDKAARLSPEVRRLLSPVIQRLESALAEQIVQPTRVRLKGEMSCSAVLAAIQQQTGNHLSGYEPLVADKSMQVNFVDTVFWQALDTVLDSIHATVALYGSQPDSLSLEPALYPESSRVSHTCYRGPFRFEATDISAIRNLRNPTTSGMRVRLEILWEPRLHPITVTLPLAQVSAKDDQARDVAVANPNAVVSAIVEQSVPGVELDVPLRLPDRSAESLATLQGDFVVLLPGREEVFEFHDLTGPKDVEQHKAGVSVTFQKLLKNEDVSEVRIRVRYDNAAEALQSHLGWVYHNKAYLRDSAGNRLDQAGVQLAGRNDTEVTLVYLFALDKKPQEYTFVYETPTLILKRKIPFELVKLPLP